jgi:hypothetical protein
MTEARANPQKPGLFDHLAARQLAPAILAAPGGLRPRLPYVFDEGLPHERAVPVEEIAEFARPQAPALLYPAAKEDHRKPDALGEVQQTEATPHRPAAIRGAPAEPGPRPPAMLQPEYRPGPKVQPVIEPSAPRRLDPQVQSPQKTPEPAPVRVHTLQRIVERAVERAESQDAAPRRPIRPAVRDEVAAPVHDSRRSAAAVPFRQGRAAGKPAETTIEIHIGRLEVRAPAASAKTAAPAPAPPDNRLAAYLRSRANGARS